MTQEPQYTWFELFMLMTRFDEISTLSLGVFISIVSGFLVMSYAIGAKLKRRQVWMVVPAYVAFVTLPFLNAFAYSSLADYHRPDKFFVADRPKFSVVNAAEPFAASNIGFLVGFLIISGSLVFFFDVRRSASKEANDGDGGAIMSVGGHEGESESVEIEQVEQSSQSVAGAEPEPPVEPPEAEEPNQ